MKVVWSRGVRGMKVTNGSHGISQVGNWLPGAVSVGPSLPVNKVLQTLAFVPGVHHIFHFVFLLAVLHDNGRARGSHRLTQKTITIGFDTGNVYDQVNAHGAGKAEFDGIGPDQLRDGIGAEPSLRELPGSTRKAEVVG